MLGRLERRMGWKEVSRQQLTTCKLGQGVSPMGEN